MKSSLNTFLNAMTFPDKTCYPVASQNVQDFYNLIDVYLDAVFHPRLTPQIFQQEGWHYELDAPDAPLIYKGVVFNEMKGDLFVARQHAARAVAAARSIRTSPTALDSGGDPKHIPDLTYDELKAFHQRHYHPSNAQVVLLRRRRSGGAAAPARRLSRRVQPRSTSNSRCRCSRVSRPQAADAHLCGARRGAAPRGEEAPRETMLTVNWMLDEVDRRRDRRSASTSWSTS